MDFRKVTPNSILYHNNILKNQTTRVYAILIWLRHTLVTRTQGHDYLSNFFIIQTAAILLPKSIEYTTSPSSIYKQLH